MREINQRTCVHAYEPNQWSWTTGVWDYAWGGVWDVNGKDDDKYVIP